MSDINRIELFGRLGGEPEFRTTQSGREVAGFSLATDTGWYDNEKGEWQKNLHWHKIVTFQPGLIATLRDRGRKGIRVIVTGELAYRTWRKDGEQTDRTESEVIVNPAGGINFVDRENSDK
jgi:single-strand DNA-binding protein